MFESCCYETNTHYSKRELVEIVDDVALSQHKHVQKYKHRLCRKWVASTPQILFAAVFLELS
jgi:hypothetical protein